MNFSPVQILEILSILAVSVIRFVPLLNSLVTSLIFMKRVEYPSSEVIKILNSHYYKKIEINEKSKSKDSELRGKRLFIEIKNLVFHTTKKIKYLKS